MRTNPSKEQELVDKLFKKPELIRWIEERLQNDERLGINIGSQEGLILRSLCSQNSVEKVVEIGTQFGCSAAWMAMGLKSRGIIYTCEKDPICAQESLKTFAHPEFSDFGSKIELFEGDARENLKIIAENGPFDLVFIDANKAGYLDYYYWAKENLKPGGYLVADNVYLFGTMFMEEPPEKIPEKMWSVMRQFLNEVFEDPTFNSSLIPTGEGLLIATKVGK